MSNKYFNPQPDQFWYRKADRPSLEILEHDVQNLGYVKTGEKYGVSDNAIRKWIKSYERQFEAVI